MKKYSKNISETIANILTELHYKEKRKKIKKKRSKVSFSKKSEGSINAIAIKNLTKILIESSIEDAKKENEKKEETIELIPIEEERDIIKNGGYGTVSKSNGYAPQVKYINYDKIWNHIGNFRTKGVYENDENVNEIAMKNGESSRQMVSGETMGKAASHFKYFMRPTSMEAHPNMYTVVSMVPPTGAGINSKDWEKYLLMMKMSIYQPILKLMASIA